MCVSLSVSLCLSVRPCRLLVHCVSPLLQTSSKKAAALRKERREVSELLKIRKYDKARIRVESIIRKENDIEAGEVCVCLCLSVFPPPCLCSVFLCVLSLPLSLLPLQVVELMCDLLHERAPLMKAEKSCPMDLVESVSTLIWAAHRMPIPELATVRKQLTKNYGKDFASGAATGTNGKVNTKVMCVSLLMLLWCVVFREVTPPPLSLCPTSQPPVERHAAVHFIGVHHPRLHRPGVRRRVQPRRRHDGAVGP